VDKELKLNETRVVYQALKRNVVIWNHFLLGFLVWVETYLVQWRTTAAVDEAIEEYETLHSSPEVHLPDPIYTEVDSPTSELLPQMRLQSPWRRD
jgi:hypothetical protein